MHSKTLRVASPAEPLSVLDAILRPGRDPLTSTAEGVETQQQLEKLQAVGCTEMQGYLFSHARPAAEIERLFLPQSDGSARAVH